MAIASGMTVIWKTLLQFVAEKFPGSAALELSRVNIPAIFLEMGGEGRLDEDDVARMHLALQNIVRHLGMVEGAIRIPEKQIHVSKGNWLRPSVGGVFWNQVKPLQRVRKGEVVAIITDLFGREKERLLAPVDGLMIGIRTAGITASGEYAGNVAEPDLGQEMSYFLNMSNSTITQIVYRKLKDLIIAFELLPGSPLTEAELSERLNVSRTPIREALRILESEGLVEMEARRGARVAQVSPRDVRAAYELREWIECASAAKAARAVDGELLKRLEATTNRMVDDPSSHEEAVATATADIEFHDLLIQATDNRFARQAIELARAITGRAAFFVPPGRYSQSREEHRAILRAISERDAESVYLLMRQHIRAASNRRFGLDNLDSRPSSDWSLPLRNG